MSRIKITEKVDEIETREAFVEAMDTVARLEVHRQQLETALKEKHQELDDKYGTEVDDLKKEIERLLKSAQPYFVEHQGELCAKGQKQGETKLAVFGIRTGMPKFVKKVKTALKALADEWFLSDELRPFVKTVRDINQKAVIDLWGENREEFDRVIPKCVRVVQEDCFWVEPKADEQVK